MKINEKIPLNKITLSDLDKARDNLKELKLHHTFERILFKYLLGELKHKYPDNKKKEIESWDLIGNFGGRSGISADFKIANGKTQLRMELQLPNEFRLMIQNKKMKGNGNPEKILSKEFLKDFFGIIEKLSNSKYNGQREKILYPKGRKKYNMFGKGEIIYKNIKLNRNLNFEELLGLFDDFSKVIEYGERENNSGPFRKLFSPIIKVLK